MAPDWNEILSKTLELFISSGQLSKIIKVLLPIFIIVLGVYLIKFLAKKIKFFVTKR